MWRDIQKSTDVMSPATRCWINGFIQVLFRQVDYFYIVGKRFPITIITKRLYFTGIPADKFQKNVCFVFLRVILSCCLMEDVWLKIELS